MDWWLNPLARALRRVPPDVLTWFALACAVAGGVLFWRSGTDAGGLGLLLAAWVAVLFNSVLDLLDGKVAHMTGKATPRGDFLDHAVDRLSDAILILGITFSSWTRPEFGAAALAATLLTSYMGTQAQAVGLRRHYGGWLGRADRMVLLLAVPLAQYAFILFGWPQPWSGPFRSLFEVMLLYFAVMGAVTTVQRLVVSLAGFAKDGKVR
jgi:archaetidylinositol phosphate synthase